MKQKHPQYIKVTVKPSSKQTKILESDQKNNTYKIAIKAPADKNKANIELLRFLKKAFKKDFKIISGKTSRTKLLKSLQ